MLTIIGWRVKRVSAWAPLLVTSLELAGLFFAGPVSWRWMIDLPKASPLLQQLTILPTGGLIAGRLLNLPVDAGQVAAYPNFGITPPPPNYLLEPATSPPGQNTESERRWQRRFGVAYGVWGVHDDIRGTELIAEIVDPALDQVMASLIGLRQVGLGPWKLVRNTGAFPEAWVARRIRTAPSWPQLFTALSLSDAPDDAWFLTEDQPSLLPIPAAQTAHVQSWDGKTAVVEHDGSCILILRRTYYPGWLSQVDNGSEQSVLKVNGGLQGVRLIGAGTSRVSMRYQPVGLRQAMAVTVTALAVAVLVLAVTGLKAIKEAPRPR